MRARVAASLFVAVLVSVAAACGSSGPSPSRSASPTASGSPATSSPSPPIDDAPAGSPAPSGPPILPTTSTCPPPAVSSLSRAQQVTFNLHVPVLMYHRVIPPSLAGDSLPSLVVPPSLFDAQLTALEAAGWHTITAAQLATALAAGRQEPAKTFVISFDDGYDDGYTYALPILKAHGFVATYYVIPGRIGGAQDLTEAHVQALAAAGMEIADHTMNHVDLNHMAPLALRYQVEGAAARIALITGQWPTTLAYPFGASDPAVVQMVENCGFGLAFTTKEGAIETWDTRLESPRMRVGPGTTPQVLLEELGPYA